MALYLVASDRLSGFTIGATVTDTDLAGCNVSALVEGGHLTPATEPKTPKTSKAAEPAEDEE